MINFDDVSVEVAGHDGPRKIISNLSFKLDQSRVALIGANGSGKSTVARLINGLVLPSGGSVSIKINDATLDTKRDGRAVRREVGFVFTDPLSQLVMPTALEDVSLSLRGVIRNKKEREQQALNVLEKYGIKELAEQSVHTLSGGQSQLLAIATVLATNPGVLVADEPTTLLDLRNSRLISTLLLALPQKLVVATHNLELAAKCDRVLWIDHGQVAYDGEPDEAIARYRASA